MTKTRTIKMEIYEADPFSCSCAGPNQARADEVEAQIRMLNEKNRVVRKLREEFKDRVEIERDIVSTKKPPSSYPEYARKLIASNTPLPLIFIEGRLVAQGAFPSLENLR